jgi:hypothetical protein
MVLSFFFSRYLDSVVWVWERRETYRGNVPCLIQTRLSDAEFGKNVATLSNQFAGSVKSPFPVPQTHSVFHLLAQRNAFHPPQ